MTSPRRVGLIPLPQPPGDPLPRRIVVDLSVQPLVLLGGARQGEGARIARREGQATWALRNETPMDAMAWKRNLL